MTSEDIAIDTGPDLSSAETAQIIADQNDRFRRAAFGLSPSETDPVGPIPQGRVVMTRGVAERSEEFQTALTAAVAGYDAFTEDADPHGWHEMGVVEIEGEIVWFRIDLYDEAYEYGAADPTDPRFTRRILTLLFPSEY